MENIINDINIANLLKNITSEDLERMEPEKQAFVIQALLKQKKVMEGENNSLIQNQKKITGNNAKKQESGRYYSSFCKGKIDCVNSEEDFTDGKIDILTLLHKSGLVPSKSEARRAVQQGGAAVNGKKVTDTFTAYTKEDFNEDFVLRRGKKNFRKIVVK